MSDYINRDDVLNCFHDWFDKHGDVHCADEMEEYRAVESLPSIEVVRCKDCKYHESPESKKGGHYCYWFDSGVKEDGYCSYGERGEQE